MLLHAYYISYTHMIDYEKLTKYKYNTGPGPKSMTLSFVNSKYTLVFIIIIIIIISLYYSLVMTTD